MQQNKGFTLIEILVVIGIIALLAAIVLIAINPARQFAQARDAQRHSDLNAILNAVGQKMADTKGISGGCPSLPTATSSIIISGTGDVTHVNLSCLAPTYVSAFPIDPSNPALPDTGYKIVVTSSGRVRVIAGVTEPNIPRTEEIWITR